MQKSGFDLPKMYLDKRGNTFRVRKIARNGKLVDCEGDASRWDSPYSLLYCDEPETQLEIAQMPRSPGISWELPELPKPEQMDCLPEERKRLDLKSGGISLGKVRKNKRSRRSGSNARKRSPKRVCAPAWTVAEFLEYKREERRIRAGLELRNVPTDRQNAEMDVSNWARFAQMPPSSGAEPTGVREDGMGAESGSACLHERDVQPEEVDWDALPVLDLGRHTFGQGEQFLDFEPEINAPWRWGG